MSRVLLLVAALFSAMIAGACSSSGENSRMRTRTQEPALGTCRSMPTICRRVYRQVRIPPSLNTTPGIPDPKVANNVPKGVTPTPGIPSPDELKKPFKPGATPTPGIPDPETLRKQMQRQGNVNASRRRAILR